MPRTDPVLSEEDVVLAGELALGVLEGDALAAARRRLIAEPAFAREVELWRDHFAAVSARGPAVEPPAAVAGRVQQALRAEQGSGTLASLSQRAVARWRAAAIGLGALGLGGRIRPGGIARGGVLGRAGGQRQGKGQKNHLAQHAFAFPMAGPARRLHEPLPRRQTKKAAGGSGGPFHVKHA